MLGAGLVIPEPSHEGTASSAALGADQVLCGQTFERLAHRGAGHVELVGQLGLGWQAFVHDQVAGEDCVADRLGNLGG